MIHGERGVTAVLGAGVAGLAAAWKLSQSRGRKIIVLEKADHTGGLASTVAFGEARLDLGSHRIHPGYFPEVLQLLRDLLGSDLLRVPRRGRLILNGRFMQYPPSLLDFLAALGPVEAARCGASFLAERGRQMLFGPREGQDTYEGYLLSAAGRRAYEVFYAPYARKVYGIDPRTLSVKAAKKRVTTGNPLALARQVATKWLRRRREGGPYFYYPAGGFGSIPNALLRQCVERGVRVMTGVTIREVRADAGTAREIVFEAAGVSTNAPLQTVISTIPLDHLVGLIRPEAPREVLEPARSLHWRGIRLLQVVVARPRCLDGETYYFPEERYLFGRVSEPQQYSPRLSGRAGETTLNIEIICSPGDPLWSLTEDKFLERVMDDIESVGLFQRSEVQAHRSVKLPKVYPIYDMAFQRHLDGALDWIESFNNLYSIGRGGMFLHGNVDHSIYLGLRLAEHLERPGARSAGWRESIPVELFMLRD